MSSFDNVARTWDENPIHMDRSLAIASKIEEKLPLNTSMKALEYGAGTGILSFLLSAKLGHITMMDSSAEMVKVMEEKILARSASNLVSVHFDLECEKNEEKFDFIFNQMVLHHISSIESIFEQFYQMLLPGGWLAIADLYLEDGSFHGDGFNGHKGFNPEQLKLLLIQSGFKKVSYEECYVVRRVSGENETKTYPVFLLIATK